MNDAHIKQKFTAARSNTAKVKRLKQLFSYTPHIHADEYRQFFVWFLNQTEGLSKNIAIDFRTEPKLGKRIYDLMQKIDNENPKRNLDEFMYKNAINGRIFTSILNQNREFFDHDKNEANDDLLNTWYPETLEGQQKHYEIWFTTDETETFQNQPAPDWTIIEPDLEAISKTQLFERKGPKYANFMQKMQNLAQD